MRVLEISRTAAAGYAGALLSLLDLEKSVLAAGGIEVVRLDAFADNSESPGGKLFLHHRKSRLKIATPRRATAAAVHLEDFDVVLEDVGAAGLKALGWSYRSLRNANRRLVIVSLSAFGLRGAYSDWQGNDFLAQAVGGVMHTCGYAGEAPLALPGEAAFMIAGLHGATAVLAAFFSQEGQEGQAQQDEVDGVHIDISAQDTFMQHWTRHVSEYAYSGVTAARAPRNPEGLHNRHTAMAKDGWLYLLALREPWQDLAAFLGLGEYIAANALAEGARQPPWCELEEAFARSVASKSKYEWFAQAADLGWTFAPVEDPFEIAASPQVVARGGMATVSGSFAVWPEEGPESEPAMPPLPWLCDGSVTIDTD